MTEMNAKEYAAKHPELINVELKEGEMAIDGGEPKRGNIVVFLTPEAAAKLLAVIARQLETILAKQKND